MIPYDPVNSRKMDDAQPCPLCDAMITYTTAIASSSTSSFAVPGMKPIPGALLFCAFCGEFLRFDDNLKLYPLPIGYLQFLKASKPGHYKQLMDQRDRWVNHS